MIIIEKNGTIALLLTQGITDLSLKNVFILQGAIIGILGALIGGVFSAGLIKIQMKHLITWADLLVQKYQIFYIQFLVLVDI